MKLLKQLDWVYSELCVLRMLVQTIVRGRFWLLTKRCSSSQMGIWFCRLHRCWRFCYIAFRATEMACKSYLLVFY